MYQNNAEDNAFFRWFERSKGKLSGGIKILKCRCNGAILELLAGTKIHVLWCRAARDQGSRAKCRQAGLFWHADGTLGADLYNHPLISSDADMRSVISLCNRRTAIKSTVSACPNVLLMMPAYICVCNLIKEVISLSHKTMHSPLLCSMSI